MKKHWIFVGLGACAAVAVALPAQAENTDPSRSALDEPVERPSEPVVITDYQPAAAGTEIVIRPGTDEVFYEFRVNGELREIKVVPARGPEYYLVPAEGGGWIREDRTRLLVPSWVLFRW